MNNEQREIQRKLRILRYAEETGHVAKTCRYFGIGRTSFYRWRQSYEKYGEDGLINRPPVPKWHANRTPIEIEEKVLHLRRKYRLGPMRIVWYLEGAVRRTRTRLCLRVRCDDLCSRKSLPLDKSSFAFCLKVVS